METWAHKTYPVNSGIDGSNALNSEFSGITSATNADFSLRGAIIPRQGCAWTAKCLQQGVSASTLTGYAVINATPGFISALPWTPVALAIAKTFDDEYPLLLMRGRTFTYDKDNKTWFDKLGAAPMSVSRRTALQSGIGAGLAALSSPSSEKNVNAIAPTFGFNDNNTRSLSLLGANNSLSSTVTTTVQGKGPGTCTMMSNYTALASVNGTSVYLFLRNNFGTVITEVTITTTLGCTVTGKGVNPVVFVNGTKFYVVWFSNTNILKITEVDPANVGAFNTHDLFTDSALNGFWACAASTGNFVVAYTRSSSASAVSTVIYNSSYTATGNSGTYPSSLSAGTEGLGPVVCGAFQNNLVWTAYQDGTGSVHVITTSTNTGAGLSTLIKKYLGVARGTSSNNTSLPTWYIQHQPIILNGRILLTLSKEASNTTGAPWVSSPLSGVDNPGANACTWTTLDFTDMYTANVGGNGTMLVPGIVACGPVEGSCEPWNPFSAIVDLNGTYFEFASVDWTQFIAQSGTTIPIRGSKGSLALNRLTWMAPKVSHMGQSSVIAGSVPHTISRGNSVELGFVDCRPTTSLSTQNLGGSLANASYTMCAVYTWTDESGQIHRSEPSTKLSITTVVGSESLNFFVGGPQITEKSYDRMYVEVYCSDKNPVTGADLYLQRTYACTATTNLNVQITAAPITTSKVLYTGGNALAAQFVGMQGGVVGCGKRLWCSDGSNVFASKLYQNGYAPEFYNNGVLTLQTPVFAGAVVGLDAIEDKVLIFCEKAVFVTTGDGPDNTGTGSDFVTIQKISDVGCIAGRAIVRTTQGIFYGGNGQSANAASLSDSSGLMLIDNSLGFTYANQKLKKAVGAIQDLCYVPDREWLIIQAAGTNYAIVLDLRAKQSAIWASTTAEYASATSIWWTSSKGTPYSLASDVSSWDRNGVGTDIDSASVVTPFSLSFKMENITPSENPDTLIKGRIRQVSLLMEKLSNTSHTVNITAKIDREVGADMVMTPVVLPYADVVTAPTARGVVDWRLPQQKMSQLELNVSVSPALCIISAVDIYYRQITRANAQTRV